MTIWDKCLGCLPGEGHAPWCTESGFATPFGAIPPMPLGEAVQPVKSNKTVIAITNLAQAMIELCNTLDNHVTCAIRGNEAVEAIASIEGSVFEIMPMMQSARPGEDPKTAEGKATVGYVAEDGVVSITAYGEEDLIEKVTERFKALLR